MSMAELLQCLPVFLRPNPAFGADCSMNRTGGAREHDMPSRANSKGEHMCSGLASDRLTDVHTDDGHGLTEKASAPCRHAATSATLPMIQLFITMLNSISSEWPGRG